MPCNLHRLCNVKSRTSDISKGKAELVLLEEDGAPGQVQRQLRGIQRQWHKAAALAPHLQDRWDAVKQTLFVLHPTLITRFLCQHHLRSL